MAVSPTIWKSNGLMSLSASLFQVFGGDNVPSKNRTPENASCPPKMIALAGFSPQATVMDCLANRAKPGTLDLPDFLEERGRRGWGVYGIAWIEGSRRPQESSRSQPKALWASHDVELVVVPIDLMTTHGDGLNGVMIVELEIVRHGCVLWPLRRCHLDLGLTRQWKRSATTRSRQGLSQVWVPTWPRPLEVEPDLGFGLLVALLKGLESPLGQV